MSMENNVENIDGANEMSQAPERGSVKSAEMYDAEGAPRQSWTLEPDHEVFFGSEKEMNLRRAEKLEEGKDK